MIEMFAYGLIVGLIIGFIIGHAATSRGWL